MATTIDDQVHILAEASQPRALIALLVPVAFPALLAFGLSTSGYTVWDYPSLIAGGQLSWFRQGAGWIVLLAFIVVYVPPAWTALVTRTFLASTTSEIIMPSGERFDLSKVRAISVRKTFWHKVLTFQFADETQKVVVTFARAKAGEIRDVLRADTNLRDIPVN